MNNLIPIVRKIARRFNWAGFFIEKGKYPLPWVIVAGYTRSGTTFLGRILANCLGCRPIHEPLNPRNAHETSFFNERESLTAIKENQRYQKALMKIFGPDFKGSKYTNTGTRLVYDGRLVKIVRGNHYLDYLFELLPGQKFVFIMRNPCACISSRLRLGWPVPNHSHMIKDIAPSLSTAQLELYEKTGTMIDKLAVSWCLDNFMALKNMSNSAFLFMHYENLVLDPVSELQRVFSHIGRQVSKEKILHELGWENMNYDATMYLSSWKKHMDMEDQRRVWEIAGIFGLSTLYNHESGLPDADNFRADGN